jgi:hypothetical protein
VSRIDYSRCIDSLFDGSPIKNGSHQAHLSIDSDNGILRYRLLKLEKNNDQ